MLSNILSFTLGEWIIAYFTTVPSIKICGCILAVVLLINGWIWWVDCQLKSVRIVAANIGLFWLAFTYVDYQANQWLQKRLEPQWIGKDIIITGTVISLPVETPQYTRFLLRSEQFAGQAQSKRLQLNWQNPHPQVQVGQRWELTVRLKPPHAPSNFGAFNRLRFLWAQGIHATGYVLPKRTSRQLPAATAPHFRLNHWRQILQQEIKQAVPDATLAAIITALTIGIESGLTEADWQTLQRTGTVHLVVIAGLHIGFMVLIASLAGQWLWRFSPKLLLRFPAQQAGAITALIFALGYGALSGFGIPAQRAVIMTVLLTMGQLCYREISVWRRIGLAFWLVIIIQPGALFAAGFWLSFGAVAWIIYSAGSGDSSRGHWRQWLRIQWALLLGLTPLTIYFFQQFSVVNMVANLPAIIWIGWLIVPLCLFATLVSAVHLVAGAWLFKVAAYLLSPLWHFLQWLAAWPYAGWRYAFPHLWMMAIALLGAAWCLAPRRVPGRWLGLLGFLPIGLLPAAKPLPGAYWLSVLDVGQGLALTVQTRHHLLVYDTGARILNGFDAGRDVVSPYLVTIGAKQIDVLMISHGDNDHSGGAKTLLAQWPVRRLLTSIPTMFYDYHPEYCTAGQEWQWDGVPFRILAPPAGSVYKGNNSSCILQIGSPGRRLLLTGDIEASVEGALTAQYGADLQSQIIVVPHHGSKTSSTEHFLQQVRPEYALFSLGYLNRFHFPAPRVTVRYQALGAQQLLTAINGAIRVNISPEKPFIISLANPSRYFWQQ